MSFVDLKQELVYTFVGNCLKSISEIVVSQVNNRSNRRNHRAHCALLKKRTRFRCNVPEYMLPVCSVGSREAGIEGLQSAMEIQNFLEPFLRMRA